MYCELHCHTHYSLLDGASSPEALLDWAAALGMPALAITDHDGLYGVVPFWRAARLRGIHPVIGAEVTLSYGSHLTLLAETQAGYANLSRLISAGQLAPAAAKCHPYLTIEDVARHAEGLLCLSGCRRGAVAQAVLADDEARARRTAGRLADIFGRDRVWIELQRHWLPVSAWSRPTTSTTRPPRVTGCTMSSPPRATTCPWPSWTGGVLPAVSST
jgi:DNA polymerase III alpha subunit